MRQKPLGNCPLFSDFCHYNKQTTKMFKNGRYVKKRRVNLMSHEFPHGSVDRGAPANCSERCLVWFESCPWLNTLAIVTCRLSHLSHSFTELKIHLPYSLRSKRRRLSRATKEVDIGLHLLLPSNLPIVVDVFCRQVIRRAGPVGKFFMWARRSCYNISLVPGIYIHMIVCWFIHASIVNYLPQIKRFCYSDYKLQFLCADALLKVIKYNERLGEGFYNKPCERRLEKG